MANTVVYMDGFENFNATKALAYFFDQSFVVSTTGQEGGFGARMHQISGNTLFSLRLGATPVLNTTWTGTSFMFKRDAGSYNNTTSVALGFANANGVVVGNCRMGLIVTSTGKIGVRYDGTASFNYTTDDIIQPNMWFHIEYRHRYGNVTNGNYEVRVNGTSVLSGVGDSSGLVPTIMAFSGSVSNSLYFYFDDLIVYQSNDASPAWLGISKVRHLPPTSTSTGQWAGSDGDSVNNHLLVDDIDAASTDWVTSTAGTAQRDLYAHAAASTGATVHAVQVRAAAGLDVIGTDDFSTVVKSGATESTVRKTLGQGTPVWLQNDPVNLDPATGTAWTKEAFDASLFGVKS